MLRACSNSGSGLHTYRVTARLFLTRGYGEAKKLRRNKKRLFRKGFGE